MKNEIVTKKVLAARKKLVKALRSGKYKQTQKVLFDGRGYCCLGIACRIDAQEKRKRFTCGYNERLYDGEAAILSEYMQEKLGFSDEGQLNKPVANSSGLGTWNSLVELNDSARYDFKQIAQVIEDQFIKNVKVA